MDDYNTELATVFDEELHQETYIIQAKLDGQRAFATLINGEIKLFSRLNNEVKGMEHIKRELANILTNEGEVIDGELYAHGSSFQEIIKGIKKNSQEVQFYIFDIIRDYKTPYFTRWHEVKNTVKGFNKLQIVPSVNNPTDDPEEIKQHLQYILNRGYEGIILRADEPHQNGRTENILKLKPVQDDEYIIRDIVKTSKGHYIAELVTAEGLTFFASLTGSHDEKEEIYNSKSELIGKPATVRHNGFTDSGLPRFPRFIISRDYE